MGDSDRSNHANSETPAKAAPPLVSILVPVYNREKLIISCLESALNQDYPNIEVIVVDNASTDQTFATIEAFGADKPAIRLFRNSTNLGPVRNWIRCVEESKGEYCKILFSDDLLVPSCVSSMVQAFDKDLAFVFSAAIVGEDAASGSVAYGDWRTGRYTSRGFLSQLADFKLPVSPCAYLYRRQDLVGRIPVEIATPQPHEYARHGAGPDLSISVEISRDYSFVGFIADPLVFFRSHPGSISVVNQDNEVLRSYRSAITYHLEKSRALGRLYQILLRYWLEERRSAKGTKFRTVVARYVSDQKDRPYRLARLPLFAVSLLALIPEFGAKRLRRLRKQS